MIQTIHELTDPFDVKTPLGDAVAMFLFSGSINSNPSFMVKIYHTGELRVVDMRDCVAYGNPSAGEKLEPQDWIVASKCGGSLELVSCSKGGKDKLGEMPTARYYKID